MPDIRTLGEPIKTTYEDEPNTNAFTDAEKTKLAGIESGAQVVDEDSVSAAGAVMESLYEANSILAANADNTPLALAVAASTIVGRGASGDIAALTPTQAKTVLGLLTAIISDITGITGADAVTNIVSLTQAEYDAILSPNATTLYVIKP